MKKLFLGIFVVILIGKLAWAQNGINPLAAHFISGSNYPAWSNEFNWSNTINMASYSNGSTNFEKFENARDQLYAQGGGVLYYPAGTYTFDIPNRGPNGRGLMLKKGVVIVGDKPASDFNAVRTLHYDSMASHGLSNMPTKFVFTDSTLSLPTGGTGKIPFMWNMIGVKKGANETSMAQVSHYGIVWVEIEMGYIFFGFGSSMPYAAKYDSSGCWLKGTGTFVNGWGERIPDGTHPMDAFAGCSAFGPPSSILPEKIIVFGVKMTNAMIPNYAIDKGKRIGPGYIENNGWRFGAKLAVNGKHLFIANNVIDKPTASFLTQTRSEGHDKKIVPLSSTIGTIRSVLFDYGYGCAMDINKGHASGMFNRCAYNDTNSLYFAEDVVIQDNWMYNHGHKSIEASGKFLVVKNNVLHRSYHGHDYNGTTKKFPYDNLNGGSNIIFGYVNHSKGNYSTQTNVDDNMSRGFDLAGANSWIHGNNYGATGSSTANDGEGILYQRHNGVEVFSVAQTYNYKNAACCKSGYIAPYDVHIVGLLQIQNINERSGEVGVLKPEANRLEDGTTLFNYDNRAKTILKAPSNLGTSPNQVDWLANNPTKPPVPPTMTLINNAVKKYVEISWTDTSHNELGYRVERKCGTETNYTIIAYRPRQETSGTWTNPAYGNYGTTPHGCGGINADYNPPVWRDYLYGNQPTCQYRVLALDSAESTAYASDVITRASLPLAAGEIKIYPNPASELVNIELQQIESQSANITLTDLNGKTVFERNYNQLDQSINIPIGMLSKGNYIVRVQAGRQLLIDKLLVE